MKRLLVVTSLFVMASVANAKTLHCAYKGDDSDTVMLTADRSAVHEYSKVRMFFNSKRLFFPEAKYDANYKPLPNHPVKMARFMILTGTSEASHFSFLVPQKIASEVFHGYLICEHCGYHNDNEYTRLTCTIN